ncbi:MAG: hypothetical protein ABW199_08925 [Caulobacterales bacterium]
MALIRSGEDSAEPIRSLNGPSRRAEPHTHAPGEPLRVHKNPEIAALEREVARLQKDFDARAEREAEALAEARASAKRDAETAFVRDEAQALAALKAGIADALQKADAQIKSLETLSLAIGETALQTAFAEPRHYQDMVGRAVQAQIGALRRETVLAVQVSAADFRDDMALRKLRETLGGGKLELRADPVLPAGACRIDVRLGQIEFSLPKHWEKLKSHLQSLAARDQR